MQKILEKIKNNKKLFFGLIAGLSLGLAITAYGVGITNDSWYFGNGWLWFKKTAGGSGPVRANVDTPTENSNIATKSYVDAAAGGVG